MLSLVIVGLSATASAVGTLAIEAYTSKKVSSINANLNNRNY
jgi:hypothetical protein